MPKASQHQYGILHQVTTSSRIPGNDGHPGVKQDRALTPLHSVSRTLTLLLRFRDHPAVTVSEASDYLSVSPSTAHRTLAMLVQHDFVRQDKRTKLYEAGPALLQVGLAAVANLDVRTVARPYVKELATLTGETVHLVMLHNTDVLFLDGMESNKAVRSGLRIGVLAPAHTTAGGKAILASLPQDYIKSLYPNSSLKERTTKSLTTFEQLESDLKEVRRRGWAMNDEESEDGLRAVAASVTRGVPLARVHVALTVAGPKDRLDPVRMTEIGGMVMRQAVALHDQLASG